MKMNKTEQQLNLLAQNMGLKLAILEGEKAVLQVELQEISEQFKQLSEGREQLKQVEQGEDD